MFGFEITPKLNGFGIKAFQIHHFQIQIQVEVSKCNPQFFLYRTWVSKARVTLPNDAMLLICFIFGHITNMFAKIAQWAKKASPGAFTIDGLSKASVIWNYRELKLPII